jgi:hypothetical protein
VEQLPPAGQIFVDFLDTVYNNKPPTLTLDEVLHVSDAVQAAEDSSRSGRVVKV